jgi:hypothetical protein
MAEENKAWEIRCRQLEKRLAIAEKELKKFKKLPRTGARLSWQKRLAHSISTFLVLGSLLAGSKVPFSPSAKEKDEKLARTPISQTLYCTPEPTPRVEIGELSKPPVAESPQPSREKIAPKSSIEVVIGEGSCFLEAANPQVADWLLVNYYNNWQNKENEVLKSQVIAKILADELAAQGVNFQRLLPGQIFKIDLAGNEKVVKVAQTQSFQEYYLLFGGQK